MTNHRNSYGLPCVWIHMHGLTFRWGRPDGYVTVLEGERHNGSEGQHDVVDSFAVSTSWTDEDHARSVAAKWIDSHPDAVKAHHPNRRVL